MFGAPGCSLYTNCILVDTIPANGTWTINIPGSQVLLGCAFYNQALILDSKANSAGLVTTNGCKEMVGSF